MQDEFRIYRLLPTAPPDDPRWENRLPQGEVIVRARSSGDARIVANEAELDFSDVDALPAEGTSTDMASPFRNEKLYTVVLDDSGQYPNAGERGVLTGTVRVDTIVSTQVD
ncbi:MAG: hypothetical protein ACK4N1_12735 [Pseudorhizobium sp.]